VDLTLEDGTFLVKLARRAVERYLERGERIKPPEDTPSKLYDKRGVFVTINEFLGGEKELRGCIGFPEPVLPLVEATIYSAISAAFEDPRFPPLRKEELDRVVFEVSVLTPPELVKVRSPKEYLSEIRVGRDGLIVEKGSYKGLLLPQVPVEQKWSVEEFLSYACMKAGLMPDAWLDEDTKIYKFQAIVFEEEEPRGSVKLKELEG